tara:strand:- start:3431 stop:4651 length:1221 start_codon:yes stop_codon:yes gene_type:complete
LNYNKYNILIFVSLVLISGFSCTQVAQNKSDKSEKNTKLTRGDGSFSLDSLVKYGLHLSLPDSSFERIKEKRNEALVKEILFKSKSDYVDGKLYCNDKEIKVKARLKGDNIDHLKGSFWSFRIKCNEKKKYIIGHNKISIQGVETRAFLKEWVFHKLLEREDVIGLQYDFLNFCVNDTLCGTYAIESHFDNYLLQLSKRPNGPIFKIDESGFWEQTYEKTLKNQDSILRNSKILICNKKWSKENQEITTKAVNLLTDYLNGRKDAKEVFNLPVWARFIAVSELMGSPHNLRWHNLRFYFNPESQKMEPIGFDNGTWLESKNVYFLNNPETFYKNMLSDTNFKTLLIKDAKRLAESSYMEAFFDEYWVEIKNYQALIRKNYPKYTFWKEHFQKSQKRMRVELDPLKP